MLHRAHKNVAIFAVAAVVIASTFLVVRDQTTVEDVAWMKAMIPHYSMAILTSERADLSDPRVRQLAEQDIEAQREEIVEMERLIGELEDP